MKKLFSTILAIIAVLTLTACSNNELADLQKVLDTKEAELTALQVKLDADVKTANDLATGYKTERDSLLEEIEDLEEDIEFLEDDIEYLESIIFDNLLTITFQNGYGDFRSATIGYENEFDGNLFELLDSEFDIEYEQYSFGKMITGFEYLQVNSGSYIAFSKNGESSMVGVELAEFKHGDVFHFEITWFDTNAQAVDQAIHSFLENQSSSFVSGATLDYNVLIGLDMLGKFNEYASDDLILSQLDYNSESTWNELLKTAYILDAMGSDNSVVIGYLNNQLSTVPTFGYANAYLGMKTFGSTESNFAAFETTVLDSYIATSPYSSGVDTGGAALQVLSLQDSAQYVALVTEYANWIHDDQLASGGFKTNDATYGETTYPGTENASSISQIILGLLANGIDPAGPDYTQGENTLITRLLEFQNEDGSFNYLMDDESADLMFSTPQAFLALVAYQYYLDNGNMAVSPYIK